MVVSLIDVDIEASTWLFADRWKSLFNKQGSACLMQSKHFTKHRKPD